MSFFFTVSNSKGTVCSVLSNFLFDKNFLALLFFGDAKMSQGNASFSNMLFQNYLTSLTLEFKTADITQVRGFKTLVQSLDLIPASFQVQIKSIFLKRILLFQKYKSFILVLFSHPHDETLALCFFLQFCMQYGKHLREYHSRDGVLLIQLLKSFSGSVHTFPISSSTHLNKGQQ